MNYSDYPKSEKMNWHVFFSATPRARYVLPVTGGLENQYHYTFVHDVFSLMKKSYISQIIECLYMVEYYLQIKTGLYGIMR